MTASKYQHKRKKMYNNKQEGNMTTEAKIDKLKERLEEVTYSDSLPKKQTAKPDLKKLKKLTKSFRETLEDYTFEPVIFTQSTKSTK